MSLPITFRPVTAQDDEFLYNLYRASREREFAGILSPEQFEMLMKMQYSARKASYAAQFPHSQHSVAVMDGVDVAQLQLDRDDRSICVVDIAVSPQYQNRGIGTFLMKTVQAEADAKCLVVHASVATNNPGSLRFHERLGFRVTESDEMYYTLEYRNTANA